MRNPLPLGVVLFFLVGCTHHPKPAAAPAMFSVLSYNIHHAAGTDGKLDVARIAKVVTESHADLAAIQEVDVRTTRVPLDEPAELARLTGMHATFAKAIDYMGGSYGQVILSRFPISDPVTYQLPSKPDKEQRIAVAVTVSPGGGRPDFRFVGTHLDHQTDADRVPQAKELLRVLDAAPAMPTMIAGDFNSYPHSAPMGLFFARFTSTDGEPWPPTVPAGRPTHRIDYVLIPKTGPWTAVTTAVLDEPIASDHRPVLAKLSWRSQGNP